MRYYALISNDGDNRLTAEPEDGLLLDLTSIDPDLTDLEDLPIAASLSGTNIDEIASRILSDGEADRFELRLSEYQGREEETKIRLYLETEFVSRRRADTCQRPYRDSTGRSR